MKIAMPKVSKSNFDNILAIEKKIKRPKKGKKAPYSVPKWFKALPVGSHGNTPSQKKAWKVVSDYVRERDFKKYAGKCVSCFRRLDRWQDGQAAHFRPWSICNGMHKFCTVNLALSCPICNYNSGADVGHEFGEELKRRYGEDVFKVLKEDNENHRGKKIEEWELVEMVAKLCPHLVK